MAAFMKRILKSKQPEPQATWYDSWLAYREREQSNIEREQWIMQQRARFF